MKKIKVGIWGLGRAGFKMHVPEIGKFPDMFEIVTGCDLDPERTKALKEKFPACNVYQDPDSFLRDKNIELVTVATRSPDHVPHTLKALSKGYYVFIEKPIAMTYADAKKLKKASQKYPGKLFLRHNRRFERGFHHISEIIASGILGDVYEIKLHRHGYQRRSDWQTLIKCGGGQLNNWGPHIIDHGLRMLESPVAEIWSDLKKIAAVGDAEDHIKIILKGENGRIVDIEISGGVAIQQPEYIVFGTKGSLVCDGDSGSNTITMKYIDPKQKLKKIKADPGNPPLNVVTSVGAAGKQENIRWIEKSMPVAPRSGQTMSNIWKALFETVRKRKKFPISIDEGLEVVRVTEIVKKNSLFAR
ncbi:MAG TPA: Gfo/Idh/MocA family oxidoreductase [Victivallales bacterium]|nr:Gfo/Idh/MocA family oxidoreductase [Victivallales bacterium]